MGGTPPPTPLTENRRKFSLKKGQKASWNTIDIIDYHWLSFIIIDHHWLSLIIDYQWLSWKLNILNGKYFNMF